MRLYLILLFSLLITPSFSQKNVVVPSGQGAPAKKAAAPAKKDSASASIVTVQKAPVTTQGRVVVTAPASDRTDVRAAREAKRDAVQAQDAARQGKAGGSLMQQKAQHNYSADERQKDVPSTKSVQERVKAHESDAAKKLEALKKKEETKK